MPPSQQGRCGAIWLAGVYGFLERFLAVLNLGISIEGFGGIRSIEDLNCSVQTIGKRTHSESESGLCFASWLLRFGMDYWDPLQLQCFALSNEYFIVFVR